MTKTVMCKGTWSEDNYRDFEVFNVKEGETDKEAIIRAGQTYSPENEFYITESVG